MSDYDRWEQSAERAEERRLADRRHRRETRALVLVSVTVIAATTLFLLSAMRGCSAGAERAHETEMACITNGGTWHGNTWRSDQGADDPGCVQGHGKEGQ